MNCKVEATISGQSGTKWLHAGVRPTQPHTQLMQYDFVDLLNIRCSTNCVVSKQLHSFKCSLILFVLGDTVTMTRDMNVRTTRSNARSELLLAEITVAWQRDNICLGAALYKERLVLASLSMCIQLW